MEGKGDNDSTLSHADPLTMLHQWQRIFSASPAERAEYEQRIRADFARRLAALTP
jgi:hypothetical protein